MYNHVFRATAHGIHSSQEGNFQNKRCNKEHIVFEILTRVLRTQNNSCWYDVPRLRLYVNANLRMVAHMNLLIYIFKLGMLADGRTFNGAAFE